MHKKWTSPDAMQFSNFRNSLIFHTAQTIPDKLYSLHHSTWMEHTIILIKHLHTGPDCPPACLSFSQFISCVCAIRARTSKI